MDTTSGGRVYGGWFYYFTDVKGLAESTMRKRKYMNRRLAKAVRDYMVVVAATATAFIFMSATTAWARPYGSGSYGTCTYGGGCSISLASSGSVDLSSIPTESGVYTVQSDSVTVATDNPSGYDLALESSSSSSSALVKGSDSIAASSGTIVSPIVLAMNTWGYRVDGTPNFGGGPTLAVTNAATSVDLFAGVPLGGNSQRVYHSDTAEPTGNTTPVWYGLAVDSGQPSGTYQQTVVYTATAAP